jgi:excisionase family DNA binding protein
MQYILLQGIKLDDFLYQIEKTIETKVNEKLESFRPGNPVSYLDRKDVAKLLKVSLVTISKWTKEGLLKSHRIGTRVRYRSDEVEEALIERNFRFHSRK